jgi:hypothetical protein
MPTIKQWISFLEELWGDEIEIIKYSQDAIVIRLSRPTIDADQPCSKSKWVN